MPRYLRPDLLQAAGIKDFNNWAATFGKVVEEMELSVAGGDGFMLGTPSERWPSNVEQRHGRIVRQGNLNPEVRISRVVTKGSFDSFMWQGLERKSRLTNQIMRGRLDVREIEDIGDNTLNLAQAKAMTSGNPLVLEKAVADQELARLSRLKRAYNCNMVAVAHTKRGEQSTADAATQDLGCLDQWHGNSKTGPPPCPGRKASEHRRLSPPHRPGR